MGRGPCRYQNRVGEGGVMRDLPVCLMMIVFIICVAVSIRGCQKTILERDRAYIEHGFHENERGIWER